MFACTDDDNGTLNVSLHACGEEAPRVRLHYAAIEWLFRIVCFFEEGQQLQVIRREYVHSLAGT